MGARLFGRSEGNELEDDSEDWPVEEVDLETLVRTFNRPTEDPMSPPTCRLMLMKLGRNLLLFNQMESALKLAVPFVHAKGTAAGDDALEEFRLALNKKNLRGVTDLLRESLKGQEPVSLKLYLDAVVHRRNALAHNFLEQPEIALTELGGRAAIRWLDDQHTFCEPMLELCKQLMVGVVYGMERQAAENGDELLVPEWHRKPH